jgi:sugar lactone lactonase YvrE
MKATTAKGPQPGKPRGCPLAVAAALLFAFTASMHGQGILTVTPSRTANTTAGTGTADYTGDAGPATAATVANPAAAAYDSNGNLYFAEANNHVIREVATSGIITVIAGTGIEGFSGDGAAATAAQLDTPTGIAVDASGNVYIADSHNHRLRKVSGGTITTIAGTGAPGYRGDHGVATAAQLSLPSAVAVDLSGNVYIADTNNQRIRKINGTTITTIAGDGEELYAGDGAAATAAALDLPTGVAVDASGNVYIADRHNQRVRMITPTGTISTIAGSGTPGFSGSFSGDGASAHRATLARPSGVSVDGAGNLYIADTGNQRIRQVSGSTIATVAGTNQQGFGGDGGPATSAILNSPRAAATDAFGNLTIADTRNQRLRIAALPTLTFAGGGVGVPSAAQSVTLANTGSASITVASVVFTGSFTTANGGSCSAIPITLAANSSCTQNIVSLPAATGIANGSVVFAGTGVVPQSILLTGAGAGVQTATTVTLTSNLASAFAGQAITFTATVMPTGPGTPTGNVLFYDGATLIGSSVLTDGSAYLITELSAGTHAITAVYAGDAHSIGSTSAALSRVVLDFSFTLSSTTNGSQTVEPGQPVTFAFNLLPNGDPFPLPITLSATGLPPGASATFTPQVITIGNSPTSFTMTIQTAATVASRASSGLFGSGYSNRTLALGLLLLPFSRRMRQKIRSLQPLIVCTALVVSLVGLGGLAGCGRGHFSHAAQNYTIRVMCTATGSGGAALQHLTIVTLTVQ